jgi:hypothetical protein
MSDNIKGELSVTLNGKSYPLRCTFDAMLAVERDLGKSMILIARDIQAGNLTLDICSVIFLHGMLAAKVSPAPTREAVGQAVFSAGVVSDAVIVAVTSFVEHALNGGMPPGKPAAVRTKN